MYLWCDEIFSDYLFTQSVTAESVGERVLKIGQIFPKVMDKNRVFCLLTDGYNRIIKVLKLVKSKIH